MYPVSNAFLTAVKANTRKYYWTGRITTTAGTVYEFDQDDMVKGSGYITSQCCGSTEIELGTVYAAEMDQFMAGNLEKEIYQKRRAEYTMEAERLDGLIADLESKLQEMEAVQDEGAKAAMETIEQFAGAVELDQKMVDALIEKVLIYDPRHVEIRWRFSDEVMKLLDK